MEIRPKLYLETTIPSYLTARVASDVVLSAHQYLTLEWWEHRRAVYDVYISDLVLEECSRGDSGAAERRLNALHEFPVLESSPAALELAALYLSRLPVPTKAKADALHMALATINGMDFLLTWNCSHIANGNVIRELYMLNSECGYVTPTICTPEELFYDY